MTVRDSTVGVGQPAGDDKKWSTVAQPCNKRSIEGWNVAQRMRAMPDPQPELRAIF
jgi:hypothetical protein